MPVRPRPFPASPRSSSAPKSTSTSTSTQANHSFYNTTSAQPITPPRSQRTFALLPFVIVAVLMLLALHLTKLVIELTLTHPATPVSTPINAQMLPVAMPQLKAPPPALLKANIPALPQNLRLGNPRGPLTLTLFTDPACLSCQAKITQWLAPVDRSQLQIVVKYWPANPNNLTGGMLLELARRKGVGAAYWNTLSQTKAPESTRATAVQLSDVQLFEQFEKQGQSLTALRQELASTAPQLVDALQPDITTAQRLRLPPPPVMVLQDYIIDDANLRASYLNRYVQRLLANEPLLPESDHYFAP